MNRDELRDKLADLHDAELLGLSVDYERGTLELRLNLWVGTEEDREAYRPGRMVVSGLQFLVIEPPAEGCAPEDHGAPSIASAGEGVPPTTAWSFPLEKPAAVMLWLYVSTWNSFIRFACASVEFH